MPRWFIFVIIAGAAWQIISAIIQQAAKKQEQEKLQEAARRAQQARATGTQQGTPQPTRMQKGTPQPIRMDKPSPIGKTHAETLAERRRAQLEELRARRRGQAGQPPPTKPTPAARASTGQARTTTGRSDPKPVPLPRPSRRESPQAVSLTTRATGTASKPGKSIRALKPTFADAQASLITHSDLERKAREIQKQRERQQAEAQQKARERAEREWAEKSRNRSAREKAEDKAREKAHEAEHEGGSVAHRLVRGAPEAADPYGLSEVVHAGHLRSLLASPKAARTAIVLTEIIGPPVSMRSA